ncbi:MAG: FmdB family transcriptional regulator [Methylobacter sp.]|nr:MAG: FmdB family transcriptional regulator [Methylobacter sp.]PPD23462.1 MAG: FmdB family transcriptional regulator [Methylobacter sp.]
MPLYDYRCLDCEHTCELLHKVSATAVCPACGSQNMEKLVSKPAPPGKMAGIAAKGRAQAAREGHLSNFSASEKAMKSR